MFCSKTAAIAQGLVSRTDLNSRRCIIIGPFPEVSGRCLVRFVGSGEETLIKEKNPKKDISADGGGDGE